jgi:hypothetical protein
MILVSHSFIRKLVISLMTVGFIDPIVQLQIAGARGSAI